MKDKKLTCKNKSFRITKPVTWPNKEVLCVINFQKNPLDRAKINKITAKQN